MYREEWKVRSGCQLCLYECMNLNSFYALLYYKHCSIAWDVAITRYTSSCPLLLGDGGIEEAFQSPFYSKTKKGKIATTHYLKLYPRLVLVIGILIMRTLYLTVHNTCTVPNVSDQSARSSERPETWNGAHIIKIKSRGKPRVS